MRTTFRTTFESDLVRWIRASDADRLYFSKSDVNGVHSCSTFMYLMYDPLARFPRERLGWFGVTEAYVDDSLPEGIVRIEGRVFSGEFPIASDTAQPDPPPARPSLFARVRRAVFGA